MRYTDRLCITGLTAGQQGEVYRQAVRHRTNSRTARLDIQTGCASQDQQQDSKVRYTDRLCITGPTAGQQGEV